MTEKKLRLFVAINIPEEIKSNFLSIQEIAKNQLGTGKWVKTDSMHLTLKFLGYCQPKKVGSIDNQLSRTANRFEAFKYNFSGLGVFPKPNKASILWIGVKEGRQELVDLASIIDIKMARLGFPPEKRSYKPHITLARFRDPISIDLSLLSQLGININIESFEASEIRLYESRLNPDGAKYFKLGTYKMQ